MFPVPPPLAEPEADSPPALTLHVRLTRACQADCRYCSSWQEDPATRMRPEAFGRALDFIIAEVLPLMGFARPGQPPVGMISVQYLGGEILTIPEAELRAAVFLARARLAPLFAEFQDGVQSNLIASPERVARLQSLFGRRIGTSVDHFSGARRVGGSAETYGRVLERARARLRDRRGVNPAAIFVVDHDSLPFMAAEQDLAEGGGYALSLRPVYAGGRAVEAATPAALAEAFAAAFDRWAMTSRLIQEPFHTLLLRRLQRLGAGRIPARLLACPFQRNCALVSLDLEPDGTLHLCQDMADAGQLPLGNALTGSFDQALWRRIAARVEHLDQRCRVCPWQPECQGGCMSEALAHTGDLYGRTELCAVWTALFQRIDALIAREGLAAVALWAHSLEGGATRRPDPRLPATPSAPLPVSA